MRTHSIEDWVDGRVDGQHHNGHPGIGLQNHVSLDNSHTSKLLST